jgi:hypothetical protein
MGIPMVAHIMSLADSPLQKGVGARFLEFLSEHKEDRAVSSPRQLVEYDSGTLSMRTIIEG